MINRILHSWSVNMTFMKLVVKFRYFARQRLAKYRNYTTRFINFILNDHSCKILYVRGVAPTRYPLSIHFDSILCKKRLSSQSRKSEKKIGGKL